MVAAQYMVDFEDWGYISVLLTKERKHAISTKHILLEKDDCTRL